MAEVLSVTRRRKFKDYTGDGNEGATGIMEGADELCADVEIDGSSVERRIVQVRLAEADHTGLIAEWVAGTATTILEAALTTEIQAISEVSPANAKGTIRVDWLSSTQKTNVIKKAVSWPGP